MSEGNGAYVVVVVVVMAGAIFGLAHAYVNKTA